MSISDERPSCRRQAHLLLRREQVIKIHVHKQNLGSNMHCVMKQRKAPREGNCILCDLGTVTCAWRAPLLPNQTTWHRVSWSTQRVGVRVHHTHAVCIACFSMQARHNAKPVGKLSDAQPCTAKQ